MASTPIGHPQADAAVRPLRPGDNPYPSKLTAEYCCFSPIDTPDLRAVECIPMGNNQEKLIVLISIILLGLGLSLILNPPIVWLLALVLMIGICVGTDSIIRSHPKIHLHAMGYSLTFWILPSLITLGASLFLRLISGGFWLVAGLAITGVLLVIVMLAEYHTVDPEDDKFAISRLVLNLATYITAFSLYAAIYSTKVRSLQSATSILIISFLLALELFRDTEATVRRTWLYALVVGLIVGETTWGLNYWAISGLGGGVFLLLVFYTVSGMIQNYFSGKLNKSVLLEYSAVTAVAFAILLTTRFWVG